MAPYYSSIRMTPQQYLNLASHFEAAAETNPNYNERETLRKLARTHFMLATVLQRSGKRLDQFKSVRRTKKGSSPLLSKGKSSESGPRFRRTTRLGQA